MQRLQAASSDISACGVSIPTRSGTYWQHSRQAGEIEDATAILSAARDKDWGPIRHKSKLHDRASYRYYWTVLQRARQTGQMLPKEADGLL